LTSALERGGQSAPRPGRFTPGKDPVPIVQEAGWASGPVWTCAKNRNPTGNRSPDCPARSQSLYRLTYFYDIVDKYSKAEQATDDNTVHAHIAAWIHKATSTHSEYVLLIAFSLRIRLHERVSMLRTLPVLFGFIQISESSVLLKRLFPLDNRYVVNLC
jgi:hypothetical protein